MYKDVWVQVMRHRGGSAHESVAEARSGSLRSTSPRAAVEQLTALPIVARGGGAGAAAPGRACRAA